MRIICLFALLPLACASGPTNPKVSRDTAIELNRDHHYSHMSNGDIVLGPSDINERVYGQRDIAGNVHVTTDRWFLQRAADLTRTQLSLASLAHQRSASPIRRSMTTSRSRRCCAMGAATRASTSRRRWARR